MRNPHSKFRGVAEFISCPGSRIHIRYESRFNGQTLELFEAGREDIQDSIEAFAPYTDLNYMLSRLKVGDQSVLCSRQPMYGDFSGLPDNPVDAINIVHAAEARFARLDADTKKSFNNDYRMWLASIMSDASSGSTDFAPADADTTPVEEEKKNEP